MPVADAAAVERAYRESSGRAVATLVRVFGDIDIAEDAVQEAFAVAAQRWPETGVPPNPGGWIVTTARNKALDRLRRESSRPGHEAQAALLKIDLDTLALLSLAHLPRPRHWDRDLTRLCRDLLMTDAGARCGPLSRSVTGEWFAMRPRAPHTLADEALPLLLFSGAGL